MPNNIKDFVNKWTGRGNEKQETQQFWNGLIFNVLAAPPDTEIRYEKPVKINGQTKFIDGYLPATKVLIEQKSLGIDLMKAETQSDGAKLTPYEQGRRYGGYLPYDEQPRWIIDSNFEEIRVHDMKKPGEAPEVIYLKDLAKDYTRLKFMVDRKDERIQKELALSLKAGELVGKIHDRFLEQYNDPMAKKTQNSLNILCTRLVFCLYAEDAGLFGNKDTFTEYIGQYAPGDIRQALLNLFKVLDTPEDERADLYLSDELEAFPYCNGGLFANENIVIPKITQEIKDTLLDASNFNWSEISPTIFGAVFESTLNNETRRSGGMHYTSIENIHKVIDPLFLDNLKSELAEIKETKVPRTRESKLRAYQDKLASLKFLDPACGSGNFLTETYVSLRRLENDVIMELNKGQIVMGFEDVANPIKVSIDQFYGFEINDFAVTVAKTALWIAEAQMMKETENIVSMHLDFLPLKTNATIIECNALQIDWWRYVDKHSLSYILGNPPFVGTKLMNTHQKDDAKAVIGDWKSFGTLDYVACWYRKAAEYMAGSSIRAALVSTNSICQGEQVAHLWKPLFAMGIKINFAYRTFIWDSEATTNKAHVHCVIVGFSYQNSQRTIFDNDSCKTAENINGYLLDAANIFIENRKTPICKDIELMHNGCKMLDDGNYILTPSEVNELLPQDRPFIRPYIGAKNFISNEKLFCIWLKESEPSEIKKSKFVMERIAKVKEFRLNCNSPDTQKYAERPMLPTRLAYYSDDQHTDALVIPIVSSSRRRYIPIGYMDKDTIISYSCMLIPNASLWSFGILESNVHSSWARTFCGRMKSDFRYSNTVVYNNFPWPIPSDEQKTKIEATAQGILDARALYPDASLADLYDELTMPIELRKAHQANDRAVMEVYGFSLKMTEQECVAELMKMYQQLTEGVK